jgi:hypothetical protein
MDLITVAICPLWVNASALLEVTRLKLKGYVHFWLTSWACNHVAPSSVRRARSVTTGAILTWNFVHVYPLVTWPHRLDFGPIWFLAWLPGGQNRKHKKCCNSWTNVWIISKCLSWVHIIRIHDILPGFLIWHTFEGHRGQSLGTVMFLPNFSPIGLQIWPAPGIHLGKPTKGYCTYVPLGNSNSQAKFRSSLILSLATRGLKHKKCYNSWTNGWIIFKFLS